jgi:hypothetical protein
MVQHGQVNVSHGRSDAGDMPHSLVTKIATEALGLKSPCLHNNALVSGVMLRSRGSDSSMRVVSGAKVS